MIPWALFWQIIILSLLGTFELVTVVHALGRPSRAVFTAMHDVICEHVRSGDSAG